MDARDDICVCGHPAAAHEHVAGFEMSPGVTFTVNDDPTHHTSMPDVWVCSGGRLVADPTEETSPWEYVCGCVLHHDPSAPQESIRTDGAAASWHDALATLVARGYAKRTGVRGGYQWHATDAGRACLAEVDGKPTTDEEKR